MDQLIALPIIANIVAGLINLFLFWKQGGQKATKDLIDLQEKQIETLKTDFDLSRTRSHDLANQLQAITLKVGILEGQAKEKDKKLEEYTQLLQNRNPELETVLKSIEQFMRVINEKLDANQNRNNVIDQTAQRNRRDKRTKQL